MSKNTQIGELINYISVNGSGDIVMTGNLIMPGGAQAATQTYVTTAISNLVASSPATLDTLNELATALGNDANFATTVATSIGTKQAQLNGTGFVKVTGTTVSYDNSTYLTSFDASSAYVPYTGATGYVNLGTNDISAGHFNATGDGGGGVLNLFKATSRTVGGSDAANTISIWADGTAIGFNDWVDGNTRTAKFSVASITNNATRTYTLPNANGTIALTSNLSSYLPLSGGTLTGPLTLPASGYIDNLASLKYAAYSWASYNTSTGAISFQNATAGGLNINAGAVTITGSLTTSNISLSGSNSPYAGSGIIYSPTGNHLFLGPNGQWSSQYFGQKTDGTFYVNGGAAYFSSTVNTTDSFFSTKTSGRSFGNDSYATNFGWISMYGTTQGIQLGFEGTTGGQLITGAAANYGILVGKAGLAISANNGGANHLNITSAGVVTFTGNVFSNDLTAGSSTYRTTIQGASSGASVRFGTLATNDSLGKIGTYSSAFNIDSNNGPISFQFASVEKAYLSSTGTFKAVQYRIAPNGIDNVYFIVDSDQTYTGQLSIQAGGGSAGYGGTLMVYGHSHTSRAGYVSAGISSGSNGKFTVMTAGNGSGSDIFTVNTSGNVVASGSITSQGINYSNNKSYHEDTASFGSNGLWQQSLGGTRYNGYNGYSVVHIKTDIRHDSARMISFNIRGFWYGPQSIDTDIQFYCYSGTGTLYGFGVYEKAETSWDYGGYYSSDDYVVLWVSGLNNYAGFSLNANNTSLIQHSGIINISAWTKANTTSAQY